MELEDEGGSAGRKRWVWITLAILLGVAGVGGAWYLLAPADDALAELQNDGLHAGPVQYLDLEPAFVVNFPHQGRQRYLQANISVMSRDSEALEAVSHHLPAIRHQLNNVLSAQVRLVFEDPAGIEALRQTATQEVQQVLLRELGREGIEDVLFTSFVMQ